MLVQSLIKIIQYLIYAVIVVVPLVYFPTSMFPFQIPKMAVFQIFTEMIFALWLALIFFEKDHRPRSTPIFWALVVFLAAIALSVFGAEDRLAALWSDEQRALGFITILHFAGFFIVLASLRDKIDWEYLWTLSFAAALAVSLIAVSQRFIAFSKDEVNIWLYIVYPVNFAERVGSTFGNSAFMAGYLLLNFFVGLWFLCASDFRRISSPSENKKFWFFGLGTLIIAFAVFLSKTLAAILGLGTGLVFILAFFSFYGLVSAGIKKASRILLAALIIFFLIFGFTRDISFWQKIPGLDRLAEASLEDESIRDRLIVWPLSWRAFKEKPLFGWGWENFRLAFDKHYDPKILKVSISGTYWDKPHNVILEYLTNAGILGLLGYLGLLGAAFYCIYRSRMGLTQIAARTGADNISESGVNQAKSGSISARPFLAAGLLAYFIQDIFIFDTIGTYLMLFLTLAFVDYKWLESAPNQKILFGSLLVFPAKYRKAGIIIFSLLALLPVYYSYQVFAAANEEYWGVNYLLNRLPESSLLYFSQAIKRPTPYIDDIRRNFANTVKQAAEQGIEYPDLPNLQAALKTHLEAAIDRHPKNFFNYITLAEFENAFWRFDKNYLDEAEELANRALELAPRRQQIYYVLAKTRLLKGDGVGAYKMYEKAVGLNPEAADPHFFLGLTAYALGDIEKGRKEVVEAERLGRRPNNVNELIALATFVGDKEGDYKKSILFYNEALELSKSIGDKSKKPDILLKLALAYYFDGQLELSRQTFGELKKMVDLKSLGIYPDLEPILSELKVK